MPKDPCYCLQFSEKHRADGARCGFCAAAIIHAKNDVVVENQALRAVLKPFAEYVESRGSEMPDDTLMTDWMPHGPTLGDCRKAKEALCV